MRRPFASAVVVVPIVTTLLLVSCATAPPPGLVVAPGDAALARRLAAIVGRTGARFGIVAVHLESGRSLTWNANEDFEAASVIKLALLAEAAARADEGRLDLNERWPLTRGAVADGSGWLDEFEPGLMPSNRDLLRIMIAVSDNTAANSFIDRFGKDAVDARMAALGLGGIRLLGRIPDKPAAGESKEWAGLVLGRMTPSATGAFYRRAAEGTLVNPRVSRAVLGVLRTQHYVDRIPRLLLGDEANEWAGKTGTMGGVRNDSGLLTTKKGRFVLVVFADRIPAGKESAVRTAIGDAAGAIVAAWSRTLPDVPKPVDEPLPPRLSPAIPRVEVAASEARDDMPNAARVWRGTDRRFWELWAKAGGDPHAGRLVAMPNSWWDGEMPWKIEPVSALILHHTSFETDEETLALFSKPESLVSSHFLVGNDGRLFQFVSLEHRAWHAGRSYLHGRQALNRTSIGVEITGDGTKHVFGAAQIETVVRLVGVLTAMFGVEAPWIAGHEHVAPGRKDDPGPLFPWNDVVRRGLELARELGPGARVAPAAPSVPGQGIHLVP